MNGVQAKYARALHRITGQFVESVQKPMLDKYIEMQQSEESANMINGLLGAYVTLQNKADEEEVENIVDYLKDHCARETTILNKSCLNNVDHYKYVIIDILQGKVAF